MKQSAYTREIARVSTENIPQWYRPYGRPLFTAYGCAVMERDTGKSWTYRTVNLATGQSEMLSRRTKRIDENAYEGLAEKISLSAVRGRGRLEADRAPGERLPFTRLHDIQDAVFRDILPQYGYAVREQQIELAGRMLNGIAARRVSLCEAEVGTGKTHAYLLASILSKRSRANDIGSKPSRMPVVISTSSIALQRALVRDYIPGLSDILMKHGVIRTPLTVAVRKGKEHYVCEHRLRQHIPFEHDREQKRILEGLLSPTSPIDLADIAGLTPHVREKIHVPRGCLDHCPRRLTCRFQRFQEEVQSPEIDIQVCNHNFLLADTLRRSVGLRPLIPDYQCLVIDEAHKLLPAARQLYGLELSSHTLQDIADTVYKLKFRHETEQKAARKAAKKLAKQGKRLFRELAAAVPTREDGAADESERLPADLGPEQTRHLRNIQDIAAVLAEMMEGGTGNTDAGRGTYRQDTRRQIAFRLKTVGEQADALSQATHLIPWMERPDAGKTQMHRVSGVEAEVFLRAIPKDLDTRLYRDLWSRGIPTILTSGTLSAGTGASGVRDFTRIKQTLGLDRVERLSETSKPSPFNHRDNALLYISQTVPFPDKKNAAYIASVTDEIEKLIRTAHGHAAVLFTSHDMLGRVHALLEKRNLPFPLYRLGRGEVSAIERFRHSGSGVLFASGSMWEGVDIPGDALSLVILVKLPFAAPDPLSDYERTLYGGMDEFKEKVVVPEMLVKLKQGFGRLIRSETDTGAVAILDSRARVGAPYRDKVLAALPDMRVTDSIADVARFLREKKPSGYFAPKNEEDNHDE